MDAARGPDRRYRILLERRRAGRRDPARASVLLWGTWLAVLGAAFSAGVYELVSSRRSRPRRRRYVVRVSPSLASPVRAGRTRSLAGVLACTAYGAYLLSDGTAVPRYAPVALCLAAPVRFTPLLGDLRGEPTVARPATVAVVACALALPLSPRWW